MLSIVEKIKQEQGYINVLINNSGVMYNTAKAPEPTDDIKAFQAKLWNAGTPEEFVKTFEVNVTGVYYTTVAFLELLHLGNERPGLPVDAPTSQVITVSSIASFRRDAGTFSLSYGSSKAAVTHMGKTLANILKGWRIRSNIIAPGVYPSGELQVSGLPMPLCSSPALPEMTQSLLDRTQKVGKEMVPLERLGQAEDMGGLVLFLVSKAGAYVSGGIHLTDGGRLGLFSSTF